MSNDHDNEFYFCTKHNAVESYDGCAAANRMGPYTTHEEAARAYEKADERNEAWDNDPNWNDD